MITTALAIACVLLFIGGICLYGRATYRLREADEIIDARGEEIEELKAACAQIREEMVKMLGYQSGNILGSSTNHDLRRLVESISEKGEPGHIVIHREQMPHLANLIEHMLYEKFDRH